MVGTLYTVVAGTPMFGEHLPTGALHALHFALRLAGLMAIVMSLLWLSRAGSRIRRLPRPALGKAATDGR